MPDGPSSKSSQPHDSLFRYVFSDPQNAEGELRTALPAEVVSRLDWSTLRVVDGTLVDEEARHLYSDLIFEVEVAEVELPVLLYVLVEHQSRSDPLMGLRLLRYMGRLWGRWLRKHAGATKLPAILPLVVHHDAVRWSAPRSFHELVDLPAELLGAVGGHVPSYRYRVDDLSEQGVAELAQRALTAQARVALACLARARHSVDLLAELEPLHEDVRALVQGHDGSAAFGALVS
ncbi:MAG: Rpn family recombination-promoting nuclease/putative transposase [Polyangiaceae bacterium]